MSNARNLSKMAAGVDTTGAVSAAKLAAGAVTNVKTNLTTEPQFDNDTSPATTGFVQRALGNFSGYAYYNANTTLTAADAGKIINMGGNGWTFTLPNVTTLLEGAKFTFVAQGGAHSIVTQASQTIWKTTGFVSSVVAYASDWVEMTMVGGGWTVTGGSALVKNAPTYASGSACAYNTAIQAPNDGVVTVQAWGQYMNSLAVYVGTDSSTPNLIATAGNDINNNTWGSSFSFPVKKGSWFKVTGYTIAYAYETVNTTFWPY